MIVRTAIFLTLAALTTPKLASAGGSGERIQLVVDAPPECLTEDNLVAEVKRLGSSVWVVDEEDRVRRFAVTVGREADHFVTRLTVRDRVGREITRSVQNETCLDAGRAASLLVSLALDEEPEPLPLPRAAEPFSWPEPVTTDAPPPPAPTPRRRGSGGVVVTARYGVWNDGHGARASGVRAYAGWPFGATRLGATLAVQHEVDGARGSRSWGYKGMSGHAGGFVGWGAPWNDSIVGFLGEAGLFAGEMEVRGHLWPSGRPITSTRTYHGPYAGAWLILQLPWKHKIRPVMGFGGFGVGDGPLNARVFFAGEVGIVWQAW